jgi:hypothetical protein
MLQQSKGKNFTHSKLNNDHAKQNKTGIEVT